MAKKVIKAKERIAQGNFKVPSPAEVVEAMTPAGSWTARQLAEWGIKWPPRKGWRRVLEDRWRSEHKSVAVTPDYNDPFAPKLSRNMMVRCRCCGRQYREGEARFEYRAQFSATLDLMYGEGEAAIWWCKTRNCDGSGVGFDLLPLENVSAAQLN